MERIYRVGNIWWENGNATEFGVWLSVCYQWYMVYYHTQEFYQWAGSVTNDLVVLSMILWATNDLVVLPMIR